MARTAKKSKKVLNVNETFTIKDIGGFRYKPNGKIQAAKQIDGKRYWRVFDTESDAYYWKKNFHPLLNPEPERPLPRISDDLDIASFRHHLTHPAKVNGENLEILFAEVWELYWNTHLLTKELHTQHNNKRVAKRFYGPLMGIKMCDINRKVISRVIEEKKKEAVQCKMIKAHRYNFNNELKKLSTLFSWYKKNFDPSYDIPVCTYHQSEGFIRKKPIKKMKMKVAEVLRFFDSIDQGLNGQFWRDFAETQFYLAARVQEVGGLQWKYVDLLNGTIEISEVAVYLGKEFKGLKVGTKNGESRIVQMNKRLRDILTRRYNERTDNTGLVFSLKGKPLTNQLIETNYNRAFKRARLEFSGTHTLRHTMANLIREHLSLDHAKAAGGWKSSRVVELIYTETPTHLSHESLTKIEDVLSISDGKRSQKSKAKCG
jgi:integrase